MSEVASPHNRKAFSTKLPTLQLAWDSVSLGELKLCPKRYYYSIILGYVLRDENAHLRFGIEFHHALEAYDKAKALGATHAEAFIGAVREAMIRTWDKKLGRPWTTDEPTKTRDTLLRTIVWYLDHFETDPCETLIMADGKPAVELSFAFETHYKSFATGETFLLCGHLDRGVKFQSRLWIMDRKTTKSLLSGDYFATFSPDNQISLYALGGSVVLNEPIAGLIIDGCQVAVTFSRFQRAPIGRTKAQNEEWYNDLGYWLTAAEKYASDGHWPMNDKNCRLCPYRQVCGASPEIRPRLLETMYSSRYWDPMEAR